MIPYAPPIMPVHHVEWTPDELVLLGILGIISYIILIIIIIIALFKNRREDER